MDDMMKMIDSSKELTDAEKKQIRAECQAAYDMEMGSEE